MTTTISILAFGIARDIIGQSSLEIATSETLTVADLRTKLFSEYPELKKLNTLAIAVNAEYAVDEQQIFPGDEVVIIPPVSGG